MQQYYAACVLPAKIMAMTVIDLLYNNGEKAKQVMDSFIPTFKNKKEYINFLESCFERKVQ